MSLVIQIIIKNNEKTLKECLESLSKLSARIKIIDIGSSDSSLEICENFGTTIEKKSLNDNFCKLRNENMDESNWFMWIQPWEKITSGWEEINLITSQIDFIKCFDFKIINRKIISRESRLWNSKLNIKFKNRIFETPDYENSIIADKVSIQQISNELDLNELEKILKIWQKDCPLTSEPSYYEAHLMLLMGKYNHFCNLANHYLFTSKGGLSDILMRYNLAQIQIYNNKAYNEGASNILPCLLHNPTIAEFWCLLGDAFYKIKEFQKAISFYENAIIIGAKRELDFFPIDISKYKEHPQKMIKSCEEIIKGTKLFSQIDK